MNHTLVAMFDDRPTAMRARDRLLAEGYAEHEVELRDDGTGTTTSGANADTATGTATAESGGFGAWLRALFGLDDEDDDVRLHSEAARRGAVALTVRTDDDARTERALELLESAGAIDLDTRAAVWRQEGRTGGSTAAAAVAGTTGVARTAGSSTDRVADADRTIPVVEERLAVGKRVVQRGGVRLYTRVVERPVEESVRLREERAEVHRRPVDRPATEADLAAMKDGTIELRETAEEAIVAKRAQVVEEVDVGRRVDERTETIRDTVRRTEVDVDNIPAGERESEHAMASRLRGDAENGGTRDPDASRGTLRDEGGGGTTGRRDV